MVFHSHTSQHAEMYTDIKCDLQHHATAPMLHITLVFFVQKSAHYLFPWLYYVIDVYLPFCDRVSVLNTHPIEVLGMGGSLGCGWNTLDCSAAS